MAMIVTTVIPDLSIILFTLLHIILKVCIIIMISRIDCPNHNAILGLLNNIRLLTFRIYSDNLLMKIKTIKAANSIRITFFSM